VESKLSIWLLGGFQATLNGQPVRGFESDKVRALAAYLFAEPTEHRREQLAGLFWPEAEERGARHNLNQALYDLRRNLKNATRVDRSEHEIEYFISTHQTVRFNTESGVKIDLKEFEERIHGCQVHTPKVQDGCERCMVLLREASDIYRGEFLAGFSLDGCPEFERWLVIQRERNHRHALKAYDLLSTWNRQNGDYSEAESFARRAVALDPLWEQAHRQLMLSIWLGGDQNEALVQYAECRQILSDELQVEPDMETEKLAQRIRSNIEMVSPASLTQQKMPHPTTAFIGRREELHQIRELLAAPSCRLLTILGPGGCGKTRLAISASRQSVDTFPDGLYFIPLSGLETQESLIPEIADSIGLVISEDREPETQLFDFLRDRQLLLIMDSFEAILAGVEMAAAILRETSGVKILATSRVPLGAEGEHRFHLGGMTYPEQAVSPDALEYSAIELFIAAAERSHRGYVPSASNLEMIVRICRLVQGMPLGIILASQWLSMLTPAEILEQIEASLDFLQVDWADLPPRQRSLRATMEYTWRLLGERSREIFSMLSVFQGGFTLEAAVEVAGCSRLEMLAFIEQSLVQKTSPTRMQIHDLLREFAHEKLLEKPDQHFQACVNHSSYFTSRLAAQFPVLRGPRQEDVLKEIDLEHSNCRAACVWALENNQPTWRDRTMDALLQYYQLRLRIDEGLGLCVRALELIDAEASQLENGQLLLRYKIWLSRFLRLSGELAEASRMREEYLQFMKSELDDSDNWRRIRAFAYLEVGQANYHSDRHHAKGAFEQSLQLYRELGDEWGSAAALVGLAGVVRYLDQLEDAVDMAEESVNLYRKVGDPRGTAKALNGLGQSLNRIGRWDEGEQCMLEMIDIFEQTGDVAAKALGQLSLGRTYIWQGRFEEARNLFRQSAETSAALGMRPEHTFATALVGVISWLLGNYSDAETVAEHSLTLSLENLIPRMEGASYWALCGVSMAHGNYVNARDQGRKSIAILRKLDNLDDVAGPLGTLACAEIKSILLSEARMHLVESLEIINDVRGVWGASFTLPSVALLLVARGEIERALEVYARCMEMPIPSSSVFHKEIVGAEIAKAASALPPEIVAAAEKRGREADTFEMAAELLEELQSKSFAV
jgi:DNA-binding SARP family transcriptional activator/predicted ATPase